MKVLALSLIALFLLASPAAADPITFSALLVKLGAAFQAAFTASALASTLLKTAVSVGLSLLAQTAQKKERPAGLQTSHTTAGGTDPQGTIVGLYATAGHLAYRNSHGGNNSYLTHVIEVSDLPGVTLSRLIIDGEYSTIGATEHADFGFPIDTKTVGVPRAWIRFVDGTHTAADAHLVATYGADAERPWTASHKLTGVAHAILTFQYLDRAFKGGVPQLRFELGGIPLYDPRADTTVGGAGSQRWANPATWTTTTNAMVVAYNILRGIALPSGEVWGGDAEAEDLPLSIWIAAMNTCDINVGTPLRKQFQTGFEIRFNEEPASVLEEILTGANAQIAELGGVWTVQVGAPAPGLVHITDDDINISKSQQFDPFPGLEATHNAIAVTHPSPNALWNASALKTITNAGWEAEDGTRRVFELRLPAVPFAEQAAQVANNMIRDERRFRAHAINLPPEYFKLAPLNTLTWTSAWNSYTTKAFEITEVAYDLRSLLTAISLRERDPADFVFESTIDLPDPPRPLTPVVEIDAGVPGFDALAITLRDGDDAARRPAIKAIWAVSLADTAASLSFQLRVSGETDLAWTGSTTELESGALIITGVLPGEDYQLRARPKARGRTTSWSAWENVTTDTVLLKPGDFDQAVFDAVNADATSIAQGLLADYSVETIAPIEADITRIDQDIELRDIDEFATQGALATINERVLWLLANASTTESTIRDAGITVDPELGRVVIAGVEAVDGKVSDVSISLDAALAEIQLRATQSYVNQQISYAVLDPSQVPIVDDLTLSISNVELRLDAAESAIELKADQTTVTGMNVTLTQAVIDIDALNDAIALKVSTSDFTALETRTQTVEVTLSTFDGANLSQSVADIRSLYDDQASKDIGDLQALLDNYEAREALQVELAYASQDLHARIAEEGEAVASILATLGASIGDSKALIEAEKLVRATANLALAQEITTLVAEIADQAAAITEINKVAADSESGNAQALHQVQLDVSAAQGDIDAQSTALSGLDTRVTTAEGTITTQAQSLVALDSDLTDAENAIAAETTARQQLDTRVTSAEGTITTQGQAQTALTSRVDDTETDIAAETTARQQLDTRVTTAEGTITTQGQAQTTLTSRVDDTETDIAAETTARQQLDTRVTSAEGAIGVQANNIISLSTTLNANTATITQQGTSLDGVLASYTVNLDVNGHISGLVLQSELGESGATLSTAAFIGDTFAIVGPGDTPLAPFVVYSTPQIVDGVTVPAGVYISDAFIRKAGIDQANIKDGSITNAKIGATIKSDNFVTGTSGWRILKDGSAEFSDVVISRQIEVAKGDFNPGGVVAVDDSAGLYLVQAWDLVETGLTVPVDQVWMSTRKTYMATAAFSGGASAAGGITGDDEFWGCTATLQPFARWNGPQQMYLRIELWAKGIQSLHAAGNAGQAGRIHWTLYEVT